MGRTIKFRGKRIDNGEWVYGNLFQGVSPHDRQPYSIILTDEKYDEVFIVDANSVGQFTGTYDDTDEEVYNHYKQRDWLTKKGTKAKSVEVLCNAWNSIPYNRIGVPKEKPKTKFKNIDWEQRRYEIAKECLSGLFSNIPIPSIEESITVVIEYTDALIEKLKND